MINRLSDENKKLFMDIVGELCENEKVLSMDNLKQHGNTTCLMHSLAVAYYSLLFVDKYNIKCDNRNEKRRKKQTVLFSASPAVTGNKLKEHWRSLLPAVTLLLISSHKNPAAFHPEYHVLTHERSVRPG